jgi:hypothetical protein
VPASSGGRYVCKGCTPTSQVHEDSKKHGFNTSVHGQVRRSTLGRVLQLRDCDWLNKQGKLGDDGSAFGASIATRVRFRCRVLFWVPPTEPGGRLHSSHSVHGENNDAAQEILFALISSASHHACGSVYCSSHTLPAAKHRVSKSHT